MFCTFPRDVLSCPLYLYFIHPPELFFDTVRRHALATSIDRRITMQHGHSILLSRAGSDTKYSDRVSSLLDGNESIGREIFIWRLTPCQKRAKANGGGSGRVGRAAASSDKQFRKLRCNDVACNQLFATHPFSFFVNSFTRLRWSASFANDATCHLSALCLLNNRWRNAYLAVAPTDRDIVRLHETVSQAARFTRLPRYSR